MSLTDSQQEMEIDPDIQHFFEHELMPLAAEMKQQQAIIPWVAFDADASTYYSTRQTTRMCKQDFETGGHSTLESFDGDLTAFWHQGGDSELCVLVPSLAKLAHKLRVVEDQDEDVSPYIYVMF